MTSPEQIRVEMTETVRQLLEDRRILLEDLQQTIHHAETTGQKFIDPGSGRCLAFHRPDRVTFWVEYSTCGDHFQIHTAYSHRMEMQRGPRGGQK